MSENKRVCGNCRFYGRSSEVQGYCQYRPPTVIVVRDEERTVFPLVAASCWCREFEAKLSTNDARGIPRDTQ